MSPEGSVIRNAETKGAHFGRGAHFTRPSANAFVKFLINELEYLTRVEPYIGNPDL